MKTFSEFILESSTLIEKTFSSREEAEKYHRENPPYGDEPYHIRRKSRAGEPEAWRPVRASKRNAQGTTRQTRSQDQTDPNVDPSDFRRSRSEIISQGKDAHHNIPLNRAASLFTGKSPEEQEKIRQRFAKLGVYFGNDPRNLLGLSKQSHKSVHRETERMDRGIERAGRQSDEIFGRIRKLREERRNKYS